LIEGIEQFAEACRRANARAQRVGGKVTPALIRTEMMGLSAEARRKQQESSGSDSEPATD
jgi:hypothetical protein